MKLAKRTSAIISLFFIGFMMASQFTMAQGNLLITPRRVVFEGKQSSQEINLANTGQDTAVYSISFLQYRMTPEGRFEEITEPDPGQLFADKFLRYFPRSVSLAPGEAQVVRMQLRRSSAMEPGEYRSHMYFRAVPEERALGEEDLLADTTAIGIRLTPIFGITIPIIIRSGETSAEITINDMTLTSVSDTSSNLSLEFNREGNRSVYGDLTVDYKPLKGSKIQVGMVRGIAVYTPNNVRQFQMDISKPEGVDFSEGKLIIRYSSSDDNKPELYAEKELLLN